MKKTLAMGLVLGLLLTALTGCSSNEPPQKSEEELRQEIRAELEAELKAEQKGNAAMEAEAKSAETVSKYPEQAQNDNQYIGIKHDYDNLPDGLVDEGGWIYNFSEPQNSEYACAMISKDNQKMIWLQKILGRDTNGNPKFEVLDVLVLPEQEHAITMDLVKDGAFYEGFGIAKSIGIDAEYYEDFYQAWRINAETEKFEEIPTQGLKGINPGYGV